MKHDTVTMAHIYLTEAQQPMKTLLAKLHREQNARGVTVFRGVAGSGAPVSCARCD